MLVKVAGLWAIFLYVYSTALCSRNILFDGSTVCVNGLYSMFMPVTIVKTSNVFILAECLMIISVCMCQNLFAFICTHSKRDLLYTVGGISGKNPALSVDSNLHVFFFFCGIEN